MEAAHSIWCTIKIIDIFLIIIVWVTMCTRPPMCNAVTKAACVMDLTDASGVITSPKYPDHYPPNYDCSWVIHAAPGSTTSITFLAFSLESDAGLCRYDYVQILENSLSGANLTRRLCGTTGRYISVTSKTTLWITFKTDSDTESSGIRAKYTQTDISAGYMKLVGGNTSYEGQLQVYYAGTWSTVCKNNWTTLNSLVVCRSLFGDRSGGSLISLTTGDTPPATAQLGLAGVDCNGAESNLLHCKRADVMAADCTNKDYVALRCFDDDVRLVNGKASNEGRLEQRVSSSWLPVCGNGFDNNATSVVCRELGLSPYNATFSVTTASSSAAENRWYKCTGSEDRLAQCHTEERPCTAHNVIISCNLPECGRVQASGPSSRIVGGVAAAESQFPWMVMLIRNSNAFFCGGAIIDPLHVVTAAHCLDDIPRNPAYRQMSTEGETEVLYLNISSTLQIIAGKHQYPTSIQYPGEQWVRVAAGIYHDRFGLETGESANDIAVLKLERPLSFNARVSALCLPKATTTVPSECTVAGWGQTNGTGKSPSQLMYSTMSAYNRSACLSLESRMSLANKITYSVDLAGDLGRYTMCLANATSGTEETCFGDSGGPTFCLNPGGLYYQLMGVVSWGYGDCPALRAFPSVMTYVPAYLTWIRQTIDHLASPCASNPCSPFSTCRDREGRFQCDCYDGYSGPLCNDCTNNMTAPQGTFTSANYPDVYSDNMDCVWIIPVKLNMFVELFLLHMDIESFDQNSSCLYDFLEIRQNNRSGPLLAYLCGRSPPTQPFVSSTTLFIHFHTDSSDVYGGFNATYTVSEFTEDAARLVDGRTTSQGRLQHYVQQNWIPVCGNSFDNNSAIVACKELGYSWHNATFSVTTTNSSAADNRWYQCTGSEDRLAQCQTTQRNCSLHSVDLNCYICRHTLTSWQSSIVSSNYPFNYPPDNKGCQWTIVVPPGMNITLSFLYVETPWSPSCSNYFLGVYENSATGRQLTKECGFAFPAPIVSRQSLFIQLVSHNTFRGFSAQYTFSGCPSYSFGENCSESCKCARENTVSCNEITGSCACKDGWSGPTCADDTNECDYSCQRSLEVCLNLPGSFECACTEGTSRNDVNICVETTVIPITVTFNNDVDFDESNSTAMATLSKKIQGHLQNYLTRKESGILDVKINRIRQGSIIVQAEVHVDKTFSAASISALLRSLQNLLGATLQVGQQYGRCDVELAGLTVSYSTTPCTLVSLLNMCNTSLTQCFDNSGTALCRSSDSNNSTYSSDTKFETWKIIAIAVGCGVWLLAAVILSVRFLYQRKKKAKTASDSRPATVSTISCGDQRSTSGRQTSLPWYAYENPQLFPKHHHQQQQQPGVDEQPPAYSAYC